MSEIADRAGVTRQAVSNWAKGAEGHLGNLKQLIKCLEIDLIEIESALSQIFPKPQYYEPNSLKLRVVKESLTLRLKEMHEGATSSDFYDIDAEGDSFFRKGFLSKNLKPLFYRAFNDKARGFDLAIIRGAGCDEEAWRVFCEGHVDDQTGCISRDSALLGSVYRGESDEFGTILTLSDVCRGYRELKVELDKICKGLDLAPASDEESVGEVVLSGVLWEHYDYDRSDHINYFFYWLSDRDGQEFLGCIFDQIKDRIVRDDQELCIFFHDAVDRSVVEKSLSMWHEDNSEEAVQVDANIFGNWNADNEADDPSRRIRDLGYISDFKNEDWAQDIVVDWLVFIGGSRMKSKARFLIPKSCTLTAFKALLESLGYDAKVKALSKGNDIHELKVKW